MNSKDYEEIAGIIKKDAIRWDDAWLRLVDDLADYFERECKHLKKDSGSYDCFNKKQFLKDCGVGEGVIPTPIKKRSVK